MIGNEKNSIREIKLDSDMNNREGCGKACSTRWISAFRPHFVISKADRGEIRVSFFPKIKLLEKYYLTSSNITR